MIKNEPPASIEGMAILVTALKISPSGRPKKYKDALYHQFDASRGKVTAEIIVALSGGVEPLYESSSTSVGSVIQGRQIWILAKTFDKLNKGKAGRSARHSGQDQKFHQAWARLVEGWKKTENPHPKEDFGSLCNEEQLPLDKKNEGAAQRHR